MFLRTTIPITEPGPVTWTAVFLCLGSAALSVVGTASNATGFFGVPVSGGWGTVGLAGFAAYITFVIGPPVEARTGSVRLLAVLVFAVVFPVCAFRTPVNLGFPLAWASLLTGIQMGVMAWARVLMVAPFFRYFWPRFEAPGLTVPLTWLSAVLVIEGHRMAVPCVLLVLVGVALGRISELRPRTIRCRVCQRERTRNATTTKPANSGTPVRRRCVAGETHPRDLPPPSQTLRASA